MAPRFRLLVAPMYRRTDASSDSSFRTSLCGRISRFGRISTSSLAQRACHDPNKTGEHTTRSRSFALRSSPGAILTSSQAESNSASHSRAPLFREPRVLLLDEPLSSLDAELRADLRSELARLQRALSLTTVYVTHDREDAAALADCVIEMRAGRILAVHRDPSRRHDPA